MSSRIRKDRGPPAGSEEQQLWQAIRSTLRLVEKHGLSSSSTLSTLADVRRAILFDQQKGPLEANDTRKPFLITSYQHLDQQYEEEQREISKALEKLELLVAVRDDSNADPSSKRKKRKTDTLISGASSSSPPLNGTPSRDRNASPTVLRDESSLLVAPTPDKEKKRSNSKSNVVTGSTTPSLQRRATLNAKDNQAGSVTSNSVTNIASSTAKEASKDPSLAASNNPNYVDPARARREVLAHQLPLQKGRKVAFRQPSKNKVGPGAANVSNMTSRSATSASAASSSINTSQGGAAAPDDEGETWIMATIIECINNDRNRYVVQDAEDSAMPTYNTTLKAIVPLPESLATLPLEDYKPGAQVMGLYPDTSCFYQATVRGGGPGINGKLTAKMQRKAEDLLQTYYRLEFEDDGGAINNVPACMVVERP